MKNLLLAAAMTLSVNAGVFDDYLMDEPAPTPTPAPAAATAADPGEPGEYGYNDLTATTDAMASAANGIYTDAATQRTSVSLASATPPPRTPDDNPIPTGSTNMGSEEDRNYDNSPNGDNDWETTADQESSGGAMEDLGFE